MHKKWRNHLVSALLIFILIGADFSLFFNVAMAAQVTIDPAISTAQAEHTILGSASVFTTDQDGYKFYVDSTGVCVFSKTTDGGTSWGAANVVDSQTDCFGITVWYDQWTPGDGGTFIHILTADPGNDDLWYNRLDTTNDSLLLGTLPVSVVVNSGQTGTIAAGSNAGSITKGTDGTIYMAMNDNTDSYVVECSSDCGDVTSWTETGANPMDAQPDWSLLMPLSGGDILLINRDISADDMRSKVWDDSAGTWSAGWTAINLNAPENATYDPGFAATIDGKTGDVYLAYVDNATSGIVGGNNDDIRTAVYSGGVWTNTTDVITDTAGGLTGVSISVDGNTSDIYVAYTSRTTPATPNTANVYWKRSTDGMATWGAENGPVNTTADDIYGVDLNNYNFERIYVSWYGITPDDMFGDTIADISPIFIVSTIGQQKSEVRLQTENFYLGGSFVFKENITNRDITSITITETGTVDAAVVISNIKLFYDLDVSAPYNCESESFSGTESQFGSTISGGFSGPNGTAIFTDTVTVSATTSLCAYVVFDVAKNATEGATIDIEISNPEVDVLISGGEVAVPVTARQLAGDTVIKANSDYKIQRGVATLAGNTLTLTAGVDYEAPQSASAAFMRITNTQNTGAGRNTGAGTSNADDTTVFITNPANITSSVTFARGTGAVNNTRVAWEIIEYRGDPGGDNEMIVRHQEGVAFASAGATVSGAVTNTVTDDADVVIFVTGLRNRNTAATAYNRGAVTATWNSGTGQAVFTRGATGSIADVSYAVVEFTGPNWKVQRVENTYAAAGVTEIESIAPVNSLNRAFLHTQKRMTVSSHANFGHEVWLSGIGQVSFLLDPAATTPTGHVSVAWVIENTQTLGTPMDVTRSNGSIASGGTSPQANIISIGKTLPDLTVSSIFTNNSSDGAVNTWPEPILSVRLISPTQYEIWRSDTGGNLDFRTEVVEWPTTERKLTQNYYRLYVNNDALIPTDPWPAGASDLGENTEMTGDDAPTLPGDTVRIRVSVAVSGSRLSALSDSFKLQFGERVTTCSAISAWSDVGAVGSSTAAWRGFNAAPTDGAQLSGDPPSGGSLLLSVSDVAGTYEEQNNSALNPHLVFRGEDIEYDWLVQHHVAAEKTSYCFRMVEDDDTLFFAYNNYPVIRTVGYEPLVTNWRWFDDETNLTLSVPFASENISPSNIENQNVLKLRVALRESSGAAGEDIRFALQFSEYADFSQGVNTLVSSSSCVENSLWCYADGAGIDGDIIPTAVLSSADACVAGVGNGCGTHNESTSTAAVTFDQAALAETEFEFSIRQAGARVNAVYYFRLYNLTDDEVVKVADGFTSPSLVTDGATLTSTLGGVATGTAIAGVTTSASTTPTSISFGSLDFETDIIAAQQISIDTNATEGYQLFAYYRQPLINNLGDIIPPISGTNATPASWNTVCDIVVETGCFGYHTTDATLFGGSARFAPNDSYAALEEVPREIMYSSIPTVDTEFILYRIKISLTQPIGQYSTDVVYIAVPVY